MEFSLYSTKFNLFTIVYKTKCLHCGLIFQYRHASYSDSLFFVDSLECSKCRNLVLLYEHYYPYKPAREYFRKDKDVKKFYYAIEAMIESCECGGKFFLNSFFCPGCGQEASKGEEISNEIQKLTYHIAPIRPLEDIPKLNDPLLEEIFKGLEKPKTREEVKKQLEEFSKTVSHIEKHFHSSD